MRSDLKNKEEALVTLQEETANLKQETADAVKKHNDAQTKYEHQMAEVSSTLNKYKVRTVFGAKLHSSKVIA